MIRQSNLTMIPEQSEIDEEPCVKWVPKKKHEVLKVKYKCLKKLFQIYDASMNDLGVPEPIVYVDDTKKKRIKRSHRTKTDACAGTAEEHYWDITQSESNTPRETSSGDISLSEAEPTRSECNKEATVNFAGVASIQDLKIKQSRSTQFEKSKHDLKASKLETNTTNLDTNASKLDSMKYAETIDSKVYLSEKEYTHNQTYDLSQHPIPCLLVNERRKLTRFQIFVQRMFGLSRDSTYILPNDTYAASDSLREKQKLRGLRCRRLKRTKKIKSENDIKDMKSPVILSFVQSVQKNCLRDKTPRQCPIPDCKMIFYGIINYNDHLNLCHFKERKFTCHYCHEGFQKEYEKIVHENEHIGLTKLSPNLSCLSNIPIQQKHAYTNNTQTDLEVTKHTIHEEKLKKIVSFFDKMNQGEVITDVRNNQSSGMNVTKISETAETDSCGESHDSSKTRTLCGSNVRKCDCESLNCSELTSHLYGSPVICQFCGVCFQNRRLLSLHMDLEHKIHNQFSKSHSFAGILSNQEAFNQPCRSTFEECPCGHKPRLNLVSEDQPRRSSFEECPCGRKPRVNLVSEDGRLNVLTIASKVNHTPYSSVNPSLSTIPTSDSTLRRGKSEQSLICDPSTNIVYCTSTESLKKATAVDSLVKKIKHYRWEPGTKIIHV